MKKFGSLLLAGAMVLSLTACGQTAEDTTTATEETADAAAEETTEEAEATTEDAEATDDAEAADTDAATDVMDYAAFMAADIDSEVSVMVYVQATQSWWEDAITIYAQDHDGGYFIYDAACSEEDAAKLVPGTKILVNGYKAEWSGEIEIADATIEIQDDGDTFIADPTDVTSFLGTDDLETYMNQFVSFSDMTVEPSTDGDGNEVAFLYNWDGSGAQGDDLYFNVSKDGQTYSFTVESYLCPSDSEVYQAVEALNIGDTVDLEGFLYWYEGANPHITSVTVK